MDDVWVILQFMAIASILANSNKVLFATITRIHACICAKLRSLAVFSRCRTTCMTTFVEVDTTIAAAWKLHDFRWFWFLNIMLCLQLLVFISDPVNCI